MLRDKDKVALLSTFTDDKEKARVMVEMEKTVQNMHEGRERSRREHCSSDGYWVVRGIATIGLIVVAMMATCALGESKGARWGNKSVPQKGE